jgi:hypothetical protein
MDSTGNPAAQIWKMIMEPIHANLETRNFNTPLDIELNPVLSPWELEATTYFIRGVDIHGNLLFNYELETTVGAEVTEHAPEVPGYILLSQTFGAIQVTEDPSRNVILFVYVSEAEELESSPSPTSTPRPPRESPAPTPTPTPSPDPTPTPTPTPSPDPTPTPGGGGGDDD